jgi:hypothetical protein
MKQVFQLALVFAMVAVLAAAATMTATAGAQTTAGATQQQGQQNDTAVLKNQVKDLISKSLVHDEQIRQLIANDEKDGGG